MLILRIKQAEVALADGRLEEACELVQADDLRSHRKGQELLGELVAAFVKRGQEHLAAGRCQQAFADAQKAFKLGGNRPEISQLQVAVAQALMSRQQSEHRKADAAGAARQQMHNGQLTMAENLLADAGSDGDRATGVQREVAAKRSRAAALIEQALKALDRQDWDAAIRQLVEARQLHVSSAQAADLSARVTQQVLKNVRESIDEGRVDRAEALVQRLVPLAGRTVDVHEAARIVEQCRLAGTYVQAGDPHKALQTLRQLSAILPQAKWLKGAIEAASQAATALEHLRAGPLGLVMPAGKRLPEVTELPERSSDSIKDEYKSGAVPESYAGVPGSNTEHGADLPQRFLLQVDGIGSYLVVRGRKTTIGPAGSSESFDVPLLAEPGLSTATIERSEEDYFVRSGGRLLVRDKGTPQKLLADGDSIALSPRCRLKFAVPNAASTSAVLQLSGTRLPRSDARRVILLDRELIIGPGTASHVRADVLTEPIVLYVRDGRLCCRARHPVTAGEELLAGKATLPLGVSIKVGPASFVVTQA